jgi:hypothetical protein
MHPDKLLPGLVEARNYFKKHSVYNGQVSLIAGLPYETPESLNKTLTWFNNNWQTENVMLFPFYIPKNDGKDTASKMSIDYVKYGYRETKENLYPRIQKMYQNIPTQYGIGEALIEATGMSWENDTWNVMDVVREVIKFYTNGYQETYGPAMWSIGELELAHDVDASYFDNKTFTELAGSSGIADMIRFLERSTSLIDSYIEKKINWRPS